MSVRKRHIHGLADHSWGDADESLLSLIGEPEAEATCGARARITTKASNARLSALSCLRRWKRLALADPDGARPQLDKAREYASVWWRSARNDVAVRAARQSYRDAEAVRLARNVSLDATLALQFTVAWAGEGRSEPKRLGWWQTDLVDEAGGGDFLARLAPRTHAWASLQLVREAARRVDETARIRLGDPDRVRSIFFLGFQTDEALDDRLGFLKRAGRPPSECLPLALPLGARFCESSLKEASGGTESPIQVPGGRQLDGPSPPEPDRLVMRLAAALNPFPSQYPLPFFREISP